MSTDNIWGNADNITIEYEKVIDENPLVCPPEILNLMPLIKHFCIL